MFWAHTAQHAVNCTHSNVANVCQTKNAQQKQQKKAHMDEWMDTMSDHTATMLATPERRPHVKAQEGGAGGDKQTVSHMEHTQVKPPDQARTTQHPH